jgi:hypothetical protein
MTAVSDADVEHFYEGHPSALEVHRAVCTLLNEVGPFEIRVTASQVAFRRQKAFAWLWLPGRWLRAPGAEVVLSIALGERHPSPRFKQVVQPAPHVWMHHLEVHAPGDLDAEVAGWLRTAYERAA